MIEAICRRAYFRFETPIHYLSRMPHIDGNVRKWDARYLLPPLSLLDDADPFADVYCAWNEDWLFAAFDVTNRHGPPHCDVNQWWKKDGLRLCLDTRDARDVKRATRFCHFFYVLPVGGGANRRHPVVGTHRMSHAKEPPPPVDVSQIRVAAQIERTRYAVEVAIPAGVLSGWDPAEHPRCGLFYKVKDAHNGAQHFTVDDELGWNQDPGTWATGVFTR